MEKQVILEFPFDLLFNWNHVIYSNSLKCFLKDLPRICRFLLFLLILPMALCIHSSNLPMFFYACRGRYARQEINRSCLEYTSNCLESILTATSLEQSYEFTVFNLESPLTRLASIAFKDRTQKNFIKENVFFLSFS